MIQRILLITNLAPHADRAMERAIQMARQFGSELAVLYAIQSDSTSDRANPLDRLDPHDIEAELRRYVATFPGGGDVSPVVATIKGSVAEAAASYARLWAPDLMVCGAHASDALADFFKVSTVERISVASPAPLLVVRNKPFGPYASALVPVEFSEISRHALETTMAIMPEGVIQLLHVFDVPAAAAVVQAPHRKLNVTAFADDFRTLTAGLDMGRRAVTRSVSEGMPKREIVTAALADPSDLIVMGTTGRKGLGRAVMGSTAHEVLERLPTDVLLVR